MAWGPNVALKGQFGDTQPTGTIAGTISELAGMGDSDYSTAGRQRVENLKARKHATAERLGAEAFSKEEAQINRDFQKMMSDTSYQRMMQDLKAAGINPMLAIQQGGASTPSGSTASSSGSPSGASSTRDSLGELVKIIGMVAAGINTAANIGAKKDITMAQIAANSELTDKKIGSAHALNEADRINKLNMQMDRILWDEEKLHYRKGRRY